MYCASQNIESTINSILKVVSAPNEAVLIMLAEKSADLFQPLQEALNEANILFFGGIFPSLIDGKSMHDEGLVFEVIPVYTRPQIIQDLDKENFRIPDFRNLTNNNDRIWSAITFVDGLTENIGAFLSKIFYEFGNRATYFGGGAGSASFVKRPCVFSNEGCFQDAAVICFIDMDISVSSGHGWEKVAGPLIATKTNKNIISELNWENAFEVYKRAISQSCQLDINSQNFFDIAKSHPVAIRKEEAENVVRDPIAVNENGELICVGEIAENSILDLLEGNEQALISSAAKVTGNAFKSRESSPQSCLVASCISRALYLGERYEKELEAMEQKALEIEPKSVLQGALTLGEISSQRNGYLEFFNKTTVVAALYDK